MCPILSSLPKTGWLLPQGSEYSFFPWSAPTGALTVFWSGKPLCCIDVWSCFLFLVLDMALLMGNWMVVVP